MVTAHAIKYGKNNVRDAPYILAPCFLSASRLSIIKQRQKHKHYLLYYILLTSPPRFLSVQKVHETLFPMQINQIFIFNGKYDSKNEKLLPAGTSRRFLSFVAVKLMRVCVFLLRRARGSGNKSP